MTRNMFGIKVDASEVRNFHERDDLDSSHRSHHHSLGWGLNQAAPGSRTKTQLDALGLIGLRIGDIVLSRRTDETDYFKKCDGQTLVEVSDEYDELEAVNGSLTLPNIAIPAGLPAGNYFMRVR